MKKVLIAWLTFLLVASPLLVPPKASAASGLAFKSVSSGKYASLAVDAAGHLWAWGVNSGTFGDGTTGGSAVPRRIDVTDGGAPVAFKDARTSWSVSMALDTTGHLWMTGDDGEGAQGNGAGQSNTTAWTKLPVSDGGTDATFTAIAVGRSTAFAVDSHGSIWGWGRAIGETPAKQNLTDGGSPVVFKGVADSNEHAIALDVAGHAWNLYSVGMYPVKYTLAAPIQSISTGNGGAGGNAYVFHTALDTDGHIWTWGNNDVGQLGDGGTTDTGTPTLRDLMDGGAHVAFKSLSAGERYALAVDAAGDIWSWGANGQGQLGDGTTANGAPHKLTVTDQGNRVSFDSVWAGSGSSSYGIDADGRIWRWGAGQLVPVKLKFAPSVALSVSPSSPSTKLQTVTLTAAVSGDYETPTGTVQFMDGASVLGSASLVGGIATYTTASLDVSTHTFTAGYLGDDSYAASVSGNAVHQVVMPAAPDVTLVPSTTSDTFDPVTVNATVQVNGSGNTLSLLKWLPGSKTAADFASAGTDILANKSFDAAANGTYTVYAKDAAGSEAVQTIDVTNILQAGDPAALNAAIATAGQALTDHPEGTNVGEAPAGARNTLQAAIDTAQAVSDDAAHRTQAQLDTATSTLNGAIAAFNGAIIGAGDPAALNAAIATAEQALTDHPEGTDVGEAPAGARNTLQAAIDTAQAVSDDAASRTQTQLDDAASTLSGAIAAFNGAIIGAGDPAALNAAIATAAQALTDHPEGAAIGEASAETRATLQAAIDAAQAVSDDAASRTQTQLDDAASTLSGAIAAFNGAVIGAGNPAALNAAIATAAQALADHPEGAAIGEASVETRATLQAAIDAAQAVSDDAANRTQAQLDAATTTLNDAVAAFGLAVVGVVLSVPDAGLYGAGDTLAFTLTYRDEVQVAGMPRLALAVGADSVAETVYAAYTGETGVSTKNLTFAYTVPEGGLDEDGIGTADRLDLPDGAAVTLAADGTDARSSFGVPATAGIRLIGLAPELALSAAAASRTTADVTVTAAVYGEATAGNSLAKLNWLRGAHDAADFAGGATGDSIVASKAFTVRANGDYTVYARDAAGNESVAVVRVSSIANPVAPANPGTAVEPSPDGGVIVRIADSDISKDAQPDGTVTERIELTDLLLDRIEELLSHAGQPTVTIAVNDTEQAVDVLVPADRLGALLAAYPDLRFEVRLNDSSFQLEVNVLDLADLASRLGVETDSMKISILTAQVVGAAKADLERLAGTKGMKLVGQAVDYRVTATGGGRSIEVTDFGGAYMARALVLAAFDAAKSYTAVVYDPAASSLSFVPAVLATRGDDKRELAMRSPHNSIYAIMETTRPSFDDLNGHWAKDDVELLASKLIVEGVSDTQFSPDGDITRAEFLALLVRAMGMRSGADAAALTFADVPATAWYAPEVAAGVKAGLANGLSADRFDPNGKVTREQMAVMLDRALALAKAQNGESAAGKAPVGFADAADLSPWARAAVERVAAAGIARGAADGRFEPQANATRAEAAAMLKRLLQLVRFIDE